MDVMNYCIECITGGHINNVPTQSFMLTSGKVAYPQLLSENPIITTPLAYTILSTFLFLFQDKDLVFVQNPCLSLNNCSAPLYLFLHCTIIRTRLAAHAKLKEIPRAC